MENHQGMRLAWRLCKLQIALIFLMALLWAMHSLEAVYSVVLAGICGILPNLLFAKKLFQHQGARSAKKIVNAFYLAEAMKLGLSILLMGLVFVLVHLNGLAFFTGFILTQWMLWFSPLLVENRSKSS